MAKKVKTLSITLMPDLIKEAKEQAKRNQESVSSYVGGLIEADSLSIKK